MNYQKLYNQLVEKAQKRGSPEGYFERHHILPKSLGGSNDKSNLVDFTAREHFIAHFLLAKIHGGAMWAAVRFMKGNKKHSGFNLNSRLYEIARRKFSESMKGNKNPFFSKVHSQEAREKMSAVKKGDKHNFFGKVHSQETREKMSAAAKGKSFSQETREKLSAARKGKTFSDETREKMSAAQKARQAANRAAKVSQMII
jgi:hypothetical protein